MAYTFLKWNKKEGREAQFVVQDDESNKQSYFTPGLMSKLDWQNEKIHESEDVSDWEDFGEEKVEHLDRVVF